MAASFRRAAWTFPAATVAITRSERRALGLAYYTLVLTQQAVFNTLFHVGTTFAYREYSPGVVTSVLTLALWRRLTRAALAEDRLGRRDAIACTALAGFVHAAVVARQVYFVGVPGDGADGSSGRPGDGPSELASPLDSLLARRHAELAIDAAGVRLDGIERDVQLGADLALRQLAAEQSENRQLRVAERLRCRSAALVRSGGQPQPALESRE